MESRTACESLIPLAVALVAWVLSFIFAPEIDTNHKHADWTDFFGTTAQVTATLFLVLVLEGRWAARTRAFAKVAGGIMTLIYVGVGLAAPRRR